MSPPTSSLKRTPIILNLNYLRKQQKQTSAFLSFLNHFYWWRACKQSFSRYRYKFNTQDESRPCVIIIRKHSSIHTFEWGFFHWASRVDAFTVARMNTHSVSYEWWWNVVLRLSKKLASVSNNRDWCSTPVLFLRRAVCATMTNWGTRLKIDNQQRLATVSF